MCVKCPTNTAYDEGYRCGMRGGLFDDCPYAVGTDRRDQWLRGYYAGMEWREVARTRRFR